MNGGAKMRLKALVVRVMAVAAVGCADLGSSANRSSSGPGATKTPPTVVLDGNKLDIADRARVSLSMCKDNPAPNVRK